MAYSALNYPLVGHGAIAIVKKLAGAKACKR